MNCVNILQLFLSLDVPSSELLQLVVRVVLFITTAMCTGDSLLFLDSMKNTVKTTVLSEYLNYLVLDVSSSGQEEKSSMMDAISSALSISTHYI